MATKRHKPEEIVTKLQQVEVLVGQGMARVDAIREVRILSQQSMTAASWRIATPVGAGAIHPIGLRLKRSFHQNRPTTAMRTIQTIAA